MIIDMSFQFSNIALYSRSFGSFGHLQVLLLYCFFFEPDGLLLHSLVIMQQVFNVTIILAVKEDSAALLYRKVLVTQRHEIRPNELSAVLRWRPRNANAANVLLSWGRHWWLLVVILYAGVLLEHLHFLYAFGHVDRSWPHRLQRLQLLLLSLRLLLEVSLARALVVGLRYEAVYSKGLLFKHALWAIGEIMIRLNPLVLEDVDV